MIGTSVERWLRNRGRPFLRVGAHHITRRWTPYSRLFTISDTASWVIAWEMRELQNIAQRLGIQLANSRWLPYAYQQAAFYGNHFDLLMKKWPDNSHRLGFAYFHGKPGTVDMPEFDKAYQRLCQMHEDIDRVQVSHSEMYDVVLNSGIAPHKVFCIPIGINLNYFTIQTSATRRCIRDELKLPQSAVIVGSFQKDGNGWDEGKEAKLIKGPDVFLQAIEQLKVRVPELFVLLSGPARGYVKAGLERLGIPYRHCYLANYPDIGKLYQALDLYMVASRQEGGPKAVLEAMASGVPLITTRVGQAMDLVQHGQNGWIVDVEDSEGLTYWAEYSLSHAKEREQVINHARKTAEANSYRAQMPRWQDFMHGFVKLAGD